jgi:hypothetical protein
MLLGLTMLLAGVVIGVVFYGMIQRKAGQKGDEEAPTSVPQQVIFDKINPPPEPPKSESHEELEQAQEPKEDERTPVKPKVVQVAIEQEPVPPEGKVKEAAPSVDEDEGEKPIKKAAMEPRGSAVEPGEQPLQPSNKVKVGVVSLHSTEQVEDDKELLYAEKKRQHKPNTVEKSKPEHLAGPDSTGQSEPIMITQGLERRSVRRTEAGQVNLHAETTPGAASLYRKAVDYQKAMKWQKAIETYNQLLRFEPMSAEVYNNIGVC